MRGARLLMVTVALASCAGESQMKLGSVVAVCFSGRIESIKTACASDGVCKMTIGGRHVTFGMGWNANPWGKVTGGDPFTNQAAMIGHPADVCAVKSSPASYTLEGDRQLFIRVR